ncbi:MAG: spore maturation protein [Muribaculaceae bacterium]|nr:spore maturation protein [Muribaculaceae bacterium]
MNYIFYFLVIFSIIIGAINGKLQDVINAVMSGAELSVKIVIALIGIMSFWLGIMRVAEKSGLIEFISKLLRPITKVLFNELPTDSPAVGDIAMNFTANAFGLANAATPFGVRAMEEMQRVNPKKDTASNSMCLFLGMNTAGFQLIPTTVLAVLVGIGYKNPAEIIAPTLLVTLIAFISAILMAKFAQKISLSLCERVEIQHKAEPNIRISGEGFIKEEQHD